ncbi:MAG: hypothetical protein JSU98_02490 [Gemmatimonadales bacterium]|jgi:hypothetical protein|nr:MAG: hypothetical protein JSU98_02490 [Gemmatimonadales bacterium]
MHSPDTLRIRGTLRVFGYPETPAEVVILRRSVPWRGVRAGAFGLGGLVVAPVVALIPPHAAWALAAVVTGLVLGGLKWAERYTLLTLSSRCPRCGAPVEVQGPTRLKGRLMVDCEGCHHGSTLTLPADSFPPGGA